MNKLGILAIVLLIFVLCVCIWYITTKNECYNNNVPKIVHLIYIPWDKDQQLKANYLDFDMGPYEEMKKQNPDYKVMLWTLPRVQEFLSQHYPEYYDTIFSLPRPTMIVDFMRLLFVYHYGGIYWQYASTQKTKSLDDFLPQKEKNIKLFTEFILDKTQCEKMKNEPIRNGKPEEPIRVCNQIFSATPKHPYLFKLFEKAVQNSKTHQVRKDYDILYIGANAMMSEIYDNLGKYQTDIELIDLKTSKEMIKISSKGSWRKEPKVEEKKLDE